MKIRTVEITRFPVRGAAPREAALLVLRDEDGLEGVGEAAPITAWSGGGETLDGAVQALNASSDRLGEVDETAPALEAVEQALSGCRDALQGSPTALFALETALLDLIARRRGVDVASCLPPASGRRGADRAVETGALLWDPAAGEVFVEAALGALAQGFRALKVKLRAEDDGALAREIEALLALRRAAPDFELRLDPNGRWSVDDARRRLAALAVLDPAFVEQPVPAAALPELGPCAVPWAADESLVLPEVVRDLTRERGCAAFVIKPAALGVGRALGLARLARERGLPVVVTHFLDGPVGLAAACETALSLSAPDPGTSLLGREEASSHAAPGRGAPSGANEGAAPRAAGRGAGLLACGLAPHSGLAIPGSGGMPPHRAEGRIQTIKPGSEGMPPHRAEGRVQTIKPGSEGMPPHCAEDRVQTIKPGSEGMPPHREGDGARSITPGSEVTPPPREEDRIQTIMPVSRLLPHHREVGRIQSTGAAGLGLPCAAALRSALHPGAPPARPDTLPHRREGT